MSILSDLDETTDQAIGSGEEFIRSTEAYYKLKLFQMLSSSLSLLVKATLIGGLVLIALIFMAVAMSIAIGNQLDSHIQGYLITGAIFIGLALLVFGVRKKIENLIIRNFSKKMFNK